MLFDWDADVNQGGNTCHVAEHMDKDIYEAILLDGAVHIGDQIVDDELRHRVVSEDFLGNAWTLVYTIRGIQIRPITVFPTTKPKELNKLAAGRPPAPMP